MKLKDFGKKLLNKKCRVPTYYMLSFFCIHVVRLNNTNKWCNHKVKIVNFP